MAVGRLLLPVGMWFGRVPARAGTGGSTLGLFWAASSSAMERTLAWLTAHRRLARDYERDPATAEAMIRWAAINGMLRQLTRGGPATRQPRRTFNWTT